MKVEQNSEWDARIAQLRIDSYNKEVRARHMQKQRRRLEHNERLKRMRNCDQYDSKRKDDNAASAEDSDSTHDIHEKIEMQKINKKFSKLMSFDIEKSFNKTQNLLNRHQKLVQKVNSLTMHDNMRPMQTRFKSNEPVGVMKYSNLTTAGGSHGQKRPPLKQSSKPLRVRFSLDRNDED